MSRDPPRLRVGLVGAGLVADIHRKGIEGAANAEIVGIADLDASAASALAARTSGAARPFGSLAELMEEEQPDVVHVLTPPPTHAGLAARALEGGAHVYVEKPMAEGVAACDAMIEAARSAGRELCVGHSMVHDPLMDTARRWLAEGRLGELLDVRAVYGFDPARIPRYGEEGHWYRGLRGGFLEDLMAHPASLVVELLGEPEVVGVTGTAPGSTEVSVLVRGGGGVSGTLHVSLRGRPEDVSLELRGTRALGRISFSHPAATLERERGIPRPLARGLKNLELAGQLAAGTVGATARHALGRLDTTKGIHTLIGKFHDALRAGQRAPVSPERGRAAVRLIRGVWPRDEEPS